MKIKIYHSPLFLTLLVAVNLLLNIQVLAQTSSPDGGCLTQPGVAAALRPVPSTSCSRSSAVYSDFFKLKESFIPEDGITAPVSVTKKIKIRLVVLEHDPSNPNPVNYRPGDIGTLNYLIERMNYWLSHISAPLQPIPAICGTCHIVDSRLRVELTEIDFVTDTNTDRNYGPDSGRNSNFLNYAKYNDSILNLYIVYTPGVISTGAWALMGSRFSDYSSALYICIRNMYVNGANMDDEARHLVHELGHCLSMPHTYYDPNEPPLEDSTNSPDYLNDIYGGNEPPVTPYAGPTNNFMDRPLQSYFSPMQLGRIQRSTFLGEMKEYTYPTESPTAHPWEITTDQTWDFTIRMFQDIRVKPGVTLTIKCEVQMPPDSRIVVEAGGKLVIDGGLITSYHGKTTWQGIEAMGNMSQPSATAYHGFVQLKNGAIIQNAVAGIRNFSGENGAQGGGIIQASNSDFYNCLRAVELNSYSTYSYGSSSSSIMSNCAFYGVTFSIDADDPFLSLPNWMGGTQFTSYDTKSGVQIRNCTFRNEIPYSIQGDGKRGNAIYVLATGMNVENSMFEGFNTGVYSAGFSGIPTRTTTLYDNHFKQVFNGIVVAGTAYGDVRNNLIEDMRPNGRGIYLDNAMGAYVGCGNTVDGYSQTISKRTGIVIRNSSASGATVMDNQFTNLFVGTQTQMDNPHLAISCNYYGSNDIAISVNPETPQRPYVLQNQGTGCGTNNIRAGNVFFGNYNKDISSYLENGWQYYAFNSGANTSEYPANTFGSVAVNNCFFSGSSDPNSICNNINSCLRFDKLTLRDIDVWRDQYHALVTAGQRYTLQGRFVFAEIVRGYGQLDAVSALQGFLEGENDDYARRLLIPLYIETGQYDKVVPGIGAMGLVETEMKGYLDYYKMLSGLHVEKRRIDQLTASELGLITDLAAGSLEVSAYAKAILDYGYSKPWEHPVEEELSSVMWRGGNNVMGLSEDPSKLSDAVPNPSDHKTSIVVTINRQDAAGNPVLMIHDVIGNIQYQNNLKEGENLVTLNTSEYSTGTYVYSLLINGTVIQAKKLVIAR